MAGKKQIATKAKKTLKDAVTMVRVYRSDAKIIARAKVDGDFRSTCDVIADLLKGKKAAQA